MGSTDEIMTSWPPGAHGTTFGGNPVSCAASLATIEAIEEEGMLENAREVGSHMLNRLNETRKKTPRVGDVRGLGLMIGVELVREDGSPDGEGLERIMKNCLENDLIVIECGAHKNVCRLMPPLNTTREEADRALDIFEEALG